MGHPWAGRGPQGAGGRGLATPGAHHHPPVLHWDEVGAEPGRGGRDSWVPPRQAAPGGLQAWTLAGAVLGPILPAMPSLACWQHPHSPTGCQGGSLSSQGSPPPRTPTPDLCREDFGEGTGPCPTRHAPGSAWGLAWEPGDRDQRDPGHPTCPCEGTPLSRQHPTGCPPGVPGGVLSTRSRLGPHPCVSPVPRGAGDPLS